MSTCPLTVHAVSSIAPTPRMRRRRAILRAFISGPPGETAEVEAHEVEPAPHDQAHRPPCPERVEEVDPPEVGEEPEHAHPHEAEADGEALGAKGSCRHRRCPRPSACGSSR